MLYVFIVPTGTTLNFDMNLAVKKVLELKTEIYQLVHIAVEDQVLLCSGGEELMSENIVGNYSGAGTDTNPIFLFSRKEISLPFNEKTSIDLTIEKKVRDCDQMNLGINTISVMRSLAQQLAELSMKGKSECSELVHQQHLQQQGWAAVIANLEDAKDCLIKRKNHLDEIYENFLENRSYYQETIKMFPDDIALLAKVPVLPKLLVLNESQCSVEDLKTEHTLLTWFCSEPQQVLESLVEKCQQSLDNLHENSLHILNSTFMEVIENAESPDYREVKGIEKRLSSLNHISETTGKLCKDQNELFNTLESADRFSQAKDPNILPDVCTWYQNQLQLMLKNYMPIGDMLYKCKAAKLELCTAINRLIPCICKLESDIYNLQCNIEFYEKHIKSVINKIESFHQVHLAPQRYLKTLAEVCRRKEFSAHFMKWATELSDKASKLHEKEVTLRKSFSSAESKNMVDNLFHGMDDMPPPFAVDAPCPFDQNLPDVSKEDLDYMKSLFPHLAHLCEVLPPDPMPHLSQVESDSAFSSNIPSSLKIVSHIFEETTDLCETSLSEKGLSKGLISLPNEVLSFTSSNTSDIENRTRRTRTSSLISFAAEAILEEKHSLSVESDEFETVDHYGTSPVEISQREMRRGFHHRPTSSSDNSLRVSRARSDGDAISPIQERLKSSDSMDFQSTEYYIDDSMPSSYSESNATSPLMRGNRMVKSHHVVVAELQRQLEEKSIALASTSSSLETNHSNVVKVHAKLSALQKFIRELQGTLQSDLSHLKEYVKEELTERMTDASDIVEKINSCVEMMQKQMMVEKEAAEKAFLSVENAYRHRLEVESQKLNDAENQIVHYEEHLQAFSSSLEEKKHENEQLVCDLQDKKELLKKIMLEHELEFDSFKIKMKDTIQEKDRTIAELQQSLCEALSEVTKLRQEKVDAQSDYNKKLETKQAMIYELQENQRSLKDEISRLQGLIGPSKDVSEVEQKLVLTLREKEECIQDAQRRFIELQEEAEKQKQIDLKQLEEELTSKHKNELESLCSQIRMVVSGTSIEHLPSTPVPPSDEAFIGLEDLRKEMVENQQKLEAEKERAENFLKQMVDQLKLEISNLEDEKNKAITALQYEHEESMERLKSRITAESQVSFNEAINSLAKEKDSVIEDLKSQVTTLEVKIASIKFHLQKYLPPREIRKHTMSQSQSSSSCGKVDLQRTEESILLNKLRLVFESLLQQEGSASASQSVSQSVHESARKKTKPKEDYQRVQLEYFPRLAFPCMDCRNRISIFTCNEDELVLIRYDKRHENYVIFHFGPHAHFLHSDSFPALKLSLPPETTDESPEELHKLILAVVVTKEFCITKKVIYKENRYKVTQGTKFYRVKVKPWDKDAAFLLYQNYIGGQMTSTVSGSSPSYFYRASGDGGGRSGDMSQSSI